MRKIGKDSLPHLIWCGFNVIREFGDTLLCRAAANWWGVQLGDGCRFYGLTVFRRHPASTITLGRQCRLASVSRYNPVGIDRRCRMTTIARHSVIQIGNGCGFSGTVISSFESIRIGNRVRCGANTTITDTDWHPLDKKDRTSFKQADAAPIRIEDDVWLGLNVTVLKGVTIGEGTVVGANSLVLHDLPDNVLAGGTPAKVIRTLEV